MAKRKFSDNYIKYGFTSILDSGKEKDHGALCYKILGNHFLRLSKLMLYLEKVHLEHKNTDRVFQKKISLCEASVLGCECSILTTIPKTC